MDEEKKLLTLRRIRELDTKITGTEKLISGLRNRNSPPSEVHPLIKLVKKCQRERSELLRSFGPIQIDLPF